MARVIPIAPAERFIPPGLYCYTLLDIAPDGRMRVRRCPFWSRDEQALAAHGEQLAGYCAYLKRGDWEAHGLSLLWDQIKECGINEPEAA